MLLNQLVLQYQIKCNTNATIVILSQRKIVKNTYGALINNYGKVSLVLVMYVLLNQVAFFISSEQFVM